MWNSSSPAEILHGRVPQRTLAKFEERLHTEGLGLRDMAVFAATLETLIHKEASERIKAAYKAHGKGPEQKVGSVEAATIIDTYMMSYILEAKLTDMTPRWANKMRRVINQVYPGWARTAEFVAKVRSESMPDRDSAWDFHDMERVIAAIADGYGLSQDQECRAIKKQLMMLEDQGTSCVGLNKFYAGNLNDGKWQFGENEEYLREAGILEESVPGHPKVIVANYMNGQSNCIAGSSFYSVCCINECEDLMDHLEQNIAAPQASPSHIVDLVSEMPSASFPMKRTLPPSAVLHLEDIARHHGGQVPLHGRLFAQWMHHAYPAECPYPHVSGTTKQLRVHDWESQSGESIVMSSEDMSEHAAKREALDGHGAGTCVPWTSDEELVVPLSLHAGLDVHSAWEVACSGLVLTSFATLLLATVMRYRRSLSKRKLKASPSVSLSEV